jgi:hypothetical protein
MSCASGRCAISLRHRIFHLLHLFMRERIIMCDVQMRTLHTLLGTVLPHVRAEDLSARRKHNVRCSVVVSELITSRLINDTVHRNATVADQPTYTFPWLLPLQRRQRLVKHMEDGRSNFDDINNAVGDAFDLHDASVVFLTARGGIEGGSIQDHNVWFTTVGQVGQHLQLQNATVKKKSIPPRTGAKKRKNQKKNIC